MNSLVMLCIYVYENRTGYQPSKMYCIHQCHAIAALIKSGETVLTCFFLFHRLLLVTHTESK